MKAPRSLLLITLGSIAWLLLVISLFYAGHKPFSPAIVLHFVTAAWQITVSFIVIALAGGVGKRLIRSYEMNPLSLLVLQSAAGLGLISIGILVSSSVIGINVYLCWIIALILALFTWRETLAWISGWRALIQQWSTSGRFGKALGVSILGLYLCSLIISLAPPTRFDALVYHLTLPKIYLLSGEVRYLPEIMFWGMPQIGEMIFAWSTGLAGTETATVLGWWVGVLALCGVIGYTADRFGGNAGWVAAAALMSGYSMTTLLASGYVEWFSILFGVGVIIAFDAWWNLGDRAGLVWAGIMTGLAMGTKYTSGVIFLAGMGVVLVHSRHTRTGSWKFITTLAAFVIPAILVFSPWLVKNLLATGNPVYPLFFPAGSMDRFRLAAYQLPPWGSWKDILLLPLRATIDGFEGAPGYSASISPLLLALAPFSLLGYRKRTEKQRIALLIGLTLGVLGWIVWVLASRFSGFLIQTRMYLGVFPAYAVLVGAGYYALAEIRLPGLRLGRVVAVMISVVMGFNILQVVTEFVNGGALAVLFNVETPEDYLNDNLGWYYPAAQAIRDLPDGARVLLLWEPRSFYCQPKCTPDEVLDKWRHARHKVGEPGEILEGWRDDGYTHLLFNRFGADYIRRDDASYKYADWVALDDLLARLGAPVEFGGAYELYSLQQ
jgi:hypothetical protein